MAGMGEPTDIQVIDPAEINNIDPEKLARKRPIGRPSKLTPDFQARFCAHVESGAFRKRAAALEGIDEVTVSRWYTRGANADPTDPTERSYRDFFIAVNHAEASCQQVAVESIKQSAASNPKTMQWFLSRRFPAEFGRQDNRDEPVAVDQAEEAKALRGAFLERLERLTATVPAVLVPADAQADGGSGEP